MILGDRVRLSIVKSLLTFVAIASGVAAHGEALYSFDNVDQFLAPPHVWPAWQNVLDQHENERQTIQRCVDDERECTRRLKSLRHVLTKGASLDRRQQIRLVNRYINRQRYQDDRISGQSGAGNQWETLTEFLHTGGDCEDFAVAKYFVLREFGVDGSDMRIVVGREPQRATHHAMLAVRLRDEVWLLENDNTIRQNGRQDIDQFVYAINEHGIWDHERPD